MKYFNIQTYGCSANQNNSEILAGLLTQSKYQQTNNPNIADILILNTCIVKQKTEDKIKRKIQDLSKQFPNKLLIITGCMPQTDEKQLKKLAPNSLLLGTKHFKKITQLIKDNNENQLNKKQLQYLTQEKEEKILLPKISLNKLISIIQISEGCLGNCSYCKTKLAKGNLHSYPKEKILKSIQSDIQSGAKEIWLTSQDCASYGLDKLNPLNNNSQSQFPQLLKEILSLKGNFKLRLGMSNPNHIYPILNQLIEIYSHKKIYKFLHIPIQSANNQVLKDMNRKYKIQQVEEIIKKFKQALPNITIATDIISSYPTETNQAHKNNLEFIKTYKPDVLNLSKFSSHKQTSASKLKQLPIKTINKRTTEIMMIHRETTKQNKEKFLNKTIQVLVNKKLPNTNIFEARDNNYNIILITSKDKSILGKTLEVKIKQIGVHHMIGEIILENQN